MSLTSAVQLQETGAMYGEFENWYENQHLGKNKTILDALDRYDKMKGGYFDFHIDSSFIYQMSKTSTLFHRLLTFIGLNWKSSIERK